ncbi:MAG: putative transporter [Bacillota bacterium]|jgi:tripartite ATP-independent transporter DctM subunit|nr:putative transporter [Bacillota bacterium]
MPLVIIVFVTALLIGLPMAFVLGLGGLAHIIALNTPEYMSIITQRLFVGVNSYSLMCIPFFVLAGDLMNKGGITQRLLAFCREAIGWINGGMAYCCVILAMVLAAILGSANAVTAILCAILVSEMAKDGYDEDFTGSLVAASGVLGPVIPPSVTFIIYGVLTGVSVQKMFVAGIVPGIMLGLGYMLVIRYYTKKRGYRKTKERFELRPFCTAFVKALPALVVPFIIVGGIMGGIFTPTESGAIAVLAAILASLIYRTFDIKALPGVLLNTGISTAGIMLIVAFGNIMGWTIAIDQIPARIQEGILSVTDNPQLVMLMIILALIVIGCVMEGFAALYIFTPVLVPLATAVGYDPIHFGIVLCIMLTIGLITPPVGMLLFVTSNISGIPLARLSKSIAPFALVAILVTVLLAYVPKLVMFLPQLMGL